MVFLLIIILLIASFLILRAVCSAKRKWERDAEDIEQEKFCSSKKVI